VPNPGFARLIIAKPIAELSRLMINVTLESNGSLIDRQRQFNALQIRPLTLLGLQNVDKVLTSLIIDRLAQKQPVVVIVIKH
jgi:hypothetical protein